MATAKKITRPVKAPVAPVKKTRLSPAGTVSPKTAAAPAKPAVPKTARPKPAAKAPASKKALPAQDVKLAKAKKPKMVRDSFTIPKPEYLVLDQLKLRATQLTRPAKKSELLRAGIKALAALSDAAFLAALEQVPAIKTGRPTLDK